MKMRDMSAAPPGKGYPGLTSTFARGFIGVALRTPKPGHTPPLSPEGDGSKAPGERTRESGVRLLQPALRERARDRAGRPFVRVCSAASVTPGTPGDSDRQG